MTVLSVPYLALIPEMALGYDARTSLNTFRTAGAVLGTFAAIGIRPTAEALRRRRRRLPRRRRRLRRAPRRCPGCSCTA